MPSPNHGRGQKGVEHVGDESGEVAFVKREVVDVGLHPVSELALRAALAAPVEGGDDKIALQQIADGFIVLFDEFAASAEQRDRAARLALGRPARRAQPDPVDCAQFLNDGAARRNVDRRADQMKHLWLGIKARLIAPSSWNSFPRGLANSLHF